MDNINKHLCSFRFTKEHLLKLKRVAVSRGTSMTDILETAITALPEKGKRRTKEEMKKGEQLWK